TELDEHGPHLPIYWGNRNWHPMLPDTLREMQAAGVRRALAFVTSAFSSYSCCRQYRENIAAAREQVGPGAPEIDKIRAFYNHPGFIETVADHVRQALQQLPAESRANSEIIFTAHSIPMAMAGGCAYESQLLEASRVVAEQLEHPRWKLVFQSRSGPPSQPWLEPDVCDYLQELHANSDVRDVVISPLGFVSDHVEVLYDLDTEARQTCEELGIRMARAATAGTHPRFVRMVRELIEERLYDRAERPACGELGPVPDVCPVDCCPSGRPAGPPRG
ncbi:MAG: ferrochelatase, partial [Planctomycetales bacterium]|nr:ferrochelatase [Planctomycetales bacterium]